MSTFVRFPGVLLVMFCTSMEAVGGSENTVTGCRRRSSRGRRGTGYIRPFPFVDHMAMSAERGTTVHRSCRRPDQPGDDGQAAGGRTKGYTARDWSVKVLGQGC